MDPGHFDSCHYKYSAPTAPWNNNLSLSGLAELFEKADIVFEQQANVVQAEHHGAHPINAKTEREASKFLGIDIYCS